MSSPFRAAVAAEIRAEMARQRKTGRGLAHVLDLSQQSASRRLTGGGAFTLDELALVADWLGVPMAQLLGNQTEAAS